MPTLFCIKLSISVLKMFSNKVFYNDDGGPGEDRVIIASHSLYFWR